MEPAFIFGIDLSSGDRFHRSSQQQTNHPSAVQSGNGQQIHHRQIHRQQRTKPENQEAVRRFYGEIEYAPGPRK